MRQDEGSYQEHRRACAVDIAIGMNPTLATSAIMSTGHRRVLRPPLRRLGAAGPRGAETRVISARLSVRRSFHSVKADRYGFAVPLKYVSAFAHTCAPTRRPPRRPCRSPCTKWTPPKRRVTPPQPP